MTVNRRDFLTTTGLAIGGGAWLVMCSRTDADVTEDYRRLVPADKGVSPEWVKSLTARGEPEDRITGFEHGADDYLAKPFEPRELVLRIGTILRRAAIAP